MHLHLEEKSEIPEGYTVADLQPTGFYQESQIQNFPVRDKRLTQLADFTPTNQ